MSLELHSSFHDSEREFPGVVQCALCKAASHVFFEQCDTLIGNLDKVLRDAFPEHFFEKIFCLGLVYAVCRPLLKQIDFLGKITSQDFKLLKMNNSLVSDMPGVCN